MQTRWLFRVSGKRADGTRDTWDVLASHRGEAFAWILTTYPTIKPASVKVACVGYPK